MANSLPPTPPRSPSPRRPLDTDSVFGSDAGADDRDEHDWSNVDDLDARPLQPQSNLPAMRRQFLAAGYREGLDAGRNDPEQAQRGFDEGYRVGAALGMRVGLLRGIAGAAASSSAQEKNSQLSQITGSLTLESLVENLQTRGLLDRELRGEELVSGVEEGVDNHDNFNAKTTESESKADWKLPTGFVEDIATVRQATQLAESWYEGQHGAVDGQPLIRQPARKHD